MLEDIEIDIINEPECFVCFDYSHSQFTKLHCCNRQNIHSQCLFLIFLNYLSLQNDKITCPLCRQEISIKDYFSLNELLNCFSYIDDKSKKKFLTKFNHIITYNYIESNQVIQVDETTSTVTITNGKIVMKKYLSVFIVIVLIIFGGIILYNTK